MRRGGRYAYRPRGSLVLRAGDELIASGPDEGQGLLADLCGWVLIEDDETGEDVLQLWAIRDGVPTSMGTFTPDAEGRVAAVMEGVVEPPGTIYAVTIEPAGGSPQPTSDPIAASSS